MHGIENLIPINRRTKEEQREIQVRAGIASGVARRKKKALKEALNVYLALPIKDEDIKKYLTAQGVKKVDQDKQMEMIVGLHNAAAAGDARAARVLIDIMGENGLSDGGVTIVDDIP